MVVYSGNNTIKYDFGKSKNKSAFKTHFVAHYADIEHEVLEVKSGYRLALIYSLCWLDGNAFDITQNRSTIHQMSQFL